MIVSSPASRWLKLWSDAEAGEMCLGKVADQIGAGAALKDRKPLLSARARQCRQNPREGVAKASQRAAQFTSYSCIMSTRSAPGCLAAVLADSNALASAPGVKFMGLLEHSHLSLQSPRLQVMSFCAVTEKMRTRIEVGAHASVTWSSFMTLI